MLLLLCTYQHKQENMGLIKQTREKYWQKQVDYTAKTTKYQYNTIDNHDKQ